MVEVLGANIPTPTFEGFGISGSTITILGIIFILTAVICIVAYILFDRNQYSRKIIVFENISGQGFQPIFNDRARLIRLGSGGEEILYLKKKKVYRTAYGKKMGKNTYWFVIGQDGYWYNSVLGDLDAKMGMLDIEPIDRDMRYMHVAIRKNIEERYNQVKFLEKYGTILMSGLFLVIMLVGIFFLLDKIANISSEVGNAVSVGNELAQANKQILSSLDNVISSGGLRQA